MDITRGLIIRQPWIEHILAGRKTWELRGGSCKINEPIALIEGGSGKVVGVAHCAGAIGPLSRSQRVMAARIGHILPEEVDEEMYAEVYAWPMENITRLPAPVPYEHPSGAVKWVTLPDATRKVLRRLTSQLPDLAWVNDAQPSVAPRPARATAPTRRR